MPRNELFIGNLNREVSQRDLEKLFDKYGKVVRCNLKDKELYNTTTILGHGVVYAFLEFEDERDAEDALKSEHGKDIRGSSMVVEYAKGRGDRRERDREGYGRNGYNRGGRSGGRSLECYNCGERGHFARDCRNNRRDNRRDNGRDRYDGRRRDRSRNRSRDRRDKDRSYERDRSMNRRRYSRSVSKNSRSRTSSRSPNYIKNRNKSPGRNASPHDDATD